LSDDIAPGRHDTCRDPLHEACRWQAVEDAPAGLARRHKTVQWRRDGRGKEVGCRNQLRTHHG
jgi:hypothetical protein